MKYIVKGKQPPALIPIHKDKSKTYKDVSNNDKVNPKITIKTDTLQALLRDQGYICCYCMQRVTIDGLNSASPSYPTIEHYIAQSTQESKDKNLDTDYKNMLATCHGNDKKDPDNKHCDSSRGATPFKFLNPLNKSCEIVLGYAEDGSIVCLYESKKEDIENIKRNINELKKNMNKNRIVLENELKTKESEQKKLDDITKDIKTLNLNFQKLKDAREAIIKGIKIAKRIERNRLKAKFDKEEFKQKELDKCQMINGKFKPFVQVWIYELNKI